MKAGKLIGFILLPLLLVAFNACKRYANIKPGEIDCTLLLGKVEVNDELIYEYEAPDAEKKEIKLKKIETITSGSYITNDFDVIGLASDEKHILQIQASSTKGLMIFEPTGSPKIILPGSEVASFETVIDGPVFEGKIASENSPLGRKMEVVKIVSNDQNEKWVEFEVENAKYASTYVFSTKYGLIKQELFKKKDSGNRELLHRVVFVSFVEGNFSKRARELGIK